MDWRIELVAIPVSDVDRAKDPDGNTWFGPGVASGLSVPVSAFSGAVG